MDQQMAGRPGSFWSSKRIRARLSEIIYPPPSDDVEVNDAAYDLHLGPEVYVSGSNKKTVLKRSEMVTIAPGQIALLLSEETVNIPTDVLGLISLKTSVKVPGLINVSGFHVDPGFRGQLVFTVYNAGTDAVAFLRGQPMFKIWFADLSDDEGPHLGRRQGQDTLSAEDISRLTSSGASPAELDKRIHQLETWVRVYGALLLALLVAVATVFVAGQ